MPLVAHSKLPAFEHLRAQGHELLTLDRALHQDIRELHIGFLNMMPDAALEATERQFICLVGGCNRIAQFFVYPFSLPGLSRSAAKQEYIERYYADFEDLRRDGLDALIITGANVATPDVSRESFWDPLIEVVSWAQANVTSILCSCLATHALLKHFHGIERQPLPSKRWGVYSHRVCAPGHPLLREINTRFDVPHSRYNDISRAQLEAADLTVLVESAEGGVHMAASRDQFRIIYLQGHPEYDVNSLLKEYKREVHRFLSRELRTPPPFPEHYFSPQAEELAAGWVNAATRARDAGDPLPEMPDREIEALLDNTWGDTAKAIVNNWLGLVYQFTNLDRKKQFMPGVDPEDPLGIGANGRSMPSSKVDISGPSAQARKSL
jgi:homoserine O-succinyltransferase